MYITVVPSLKTMLISKVASSFYYDPQIRILEKDLHEPICFRSGHDWEPTVHQRLAKIFPLETLRNEVVSAFKPISCEVVMWGYDHSEVNRGFTSSINLWTCFKWTSLGIIDREQTAKRAAAKRNIAIVDRFLLACNYRLKKEIFELWGCMSEENKELVKSIIHSPMVDRWVECLEHGGEPKASELVEDFLKPRPAYSECNKSAGLRRLFPDISMEERFQCLMCSIEHREIHPNDLRYCLSQLDSDHQIEVFQKHTFRVLKSFLHWPLQSKFMDLANQMWTFLSEKDFSDLLHVLLCQIIMKGWEDFDYVSLLRNFWLQSPPHLKEFAKKTRIYEFALRTVFEYVGAGLFPLRLLRGFMCNCYKDRKIIYIE